MKLILCDEYKKTTEYQMNKKLRNINRKYIFKNVIYDYCDKYKIREIDLNNLINFFKEKKKINLNKLNNYKKNYSRGILPTLIKICELNHYKGYYSAHYKKISILHIRENVTVYVFDDINGIIISFRAKHTTEDLKHIFLDSLRDEYKFINKKTEQEFKKWHNSYL